MDASAFYDAAYNAGKNNVTLSSSGGTTGSTSTTVTITASNGKKKTITVTVNANGMISNVGIS